jgi:signal transduction histidine kinase
VNQQPPVGAREDGRTDQVDDARRQTAKATSSRRAPGRRGPLRLMLPLESELYDRLRWFVWLRSHAAILVGAAGLLCWYYDLGVDGGQIVAVGAAIAVINVVLLLTGRHVRDWPVTVAHTQISLDWIALSVLMHLTGGMNSPVLMFFIFHVIFAALLIPGLGAFIHAGLATSIVAVDGYLESTGAIDHVRLVWMGDGPPTGTHLVVLVTFFAAVMFVSALIAWATAHHLRSVERDQANLQRELAGAVRQLEAANSELIRMDEEKGNYVRTVTHQLRSPLSAIQSLLRVLVDGYGGKLEEQTMNMIQRAEYRVLALIETVSDLLRVAEFDFQPHRGDGEVVNVADTARGILLEIREKADVSGVALVDQLPPDLPVLADSEDITNALHNLIENAVKYTPEGGTVTVSGATIDTQISISVADTGIGIPPESQADLFNEFYRAANAKALQSTGTGLGLVIARRSAERWGGTIAFESDGESGTTFTLTLPLFNI